MESKNISVEEISLPIQLRCKCHRIRNLALIAMGHFLIAIVIFLPSVIRNNGLLTMAEDFNAQGIPFLYLVHDAIRNGDIFWNWYIDIGSDFWSLTMPAGGWTSPSMWIVPRVPRTWLPYLPTVILAMKYTVAGVCSFLFLKRYAHDNFIAFAGSLLYAFSGNFACSLVFSMQDGAAFFPLLLWALDELLENKHRGPFTIAVFLNICASFSLFISSFIALLIYFFVKYWSWDRKLWNRIGLCILEGLLGVGIAGFVFIPSAIALLSSSRTALALHGSSALTYSTQDILLLIRGILFPGEAMSNTTSIVENDWWSNAAYLPMVSVILVGAYVVREKDWLQQIIVLCAIIALVPILNNIFMLEMSGNYRRWFNFPIILMAAASVFCMNKPEDYPVIRMSLVVLGVILVYCAFVFCFPWENGETIAIYDRKRLNTAICYAVIGVIATAAIWFLGKQRDNISLLLTAGIIIFSIVTNIYTLTSYQLPSAHSAGTGNSTQEVWNELTGTGELVPEEMGDLLPYRVEYWNNYWNYGWVNHWASRQSFISVVDPEIGELYSALGAERSLAFTPDGPDGTSALLSVKYRILREQNSSYRLLNQLDNGNYQLYFYEDVNALPIGFTYDTYMLRSEFDQIKPQMRAYAMLKTLVIRDEDEVDVSKVLRKYDVQRDGDYSHGDILELQLEHYDGRSYNFSRTSRTFSVEITAGSNEYAFFSVACNPCWTAKVNGKSTEIYNINGLMAVQVVEGKNRIEFTYTPWNAIVGCAVSILFLLAFIVYIHELKSDTIQMCHHKMKKGKAI